MKPTTAINKGIIFGMGALLSIQILFVAWFVISGICFKNEALSDEMLLKTWWKYYDGQCQSDVYKLSKEQLVNKDKNLALEYRWYDKTVIMTFKDGSGCTYISKGYD